MLRRIYQCHVGHNQLPPPRPQGRRCKREDGGSVCRTQRIDSPAEVPGRVARLAPCSPAAPARGCLRPLLIERDHAQAIHDWLDQSGLHRDVPAGPKVPFAEHCWDTMPRRAAPHGDPTNVEVQTGLPVASLAMIVSAVQRAIANDLCPPWPS